MYHVNAVLRPRYSASAVRTFSMWYKVVAEMAKKSVRKPAADAKYASVESLDSLHFGQYPKVGLGLLAIEAG